MGRWIGYNIQGHVYTAPQMMALRRIIAGHSIGEGGGTRRTVNVLKREGTVTEPKRHIPGYRVRQAGCGHRRPSGRHATASGVLEPHRHRPSQRILGLPLQPSENLPS